MCLLQHTDVYAHAHTRACAHTPLAVDPQVIVFHPCWEAMSGHCSAFL